MKVFILCPEINQITKEKLAQKKKNYKEIKRADNQVLEAIIVKIPSLNYIDRESSIILTVRQQPKNFLSKKKKISFIFSVFWP